MELLGTVCALWGNIKQGSSSAASQHPAPSRAGGNFPSSSQGFEGIRESEREFATAAGEDLAVPC